MAGRTDAFENSPRCGAKTRSGAPCRRIGSSRNGRCRLHGGLAGAPFGKRNGRWRHGLWTNEAKAIRSALQTLLRDAEEFLKGR
jgi:glucans biosynthesis protein